MTKKIQILLIVISSIILLKLISCQWTINDNELSKDRNKTYCKYCELAEKGINKGEWTCDKCVYVVDKYQANGYLYIDVVTNRKITKYEAWKRKYYALDHLCYFNYVLRIKETEDSKKIYDDITYGTRIHVYKDVDLTDETLYLVDIKVTEISVR